ncbi:MAG: hypothetical protein ACREAU_01125 [Nitrosopumilaceae archaeon]
MKKLNEKKDLELLTQLLEMIKDPANHLESIHSDLESVGVKYAFIGGLALRPHSYSRMTTDIDILISKNTVEKLKELLGQGYTLRPGASKNMYLHVANSRIFVDILVEDQKENGVLLPDPTQIRQKINGVWYASLPALINLKLQAGRPQDVVDVLKLIEANELHQTYINNLSPNVHKKFLNLFINHGETK